MLRESRENVHSRRRYTFTHGQREVVEQLQKGKAEGVSEAVQNHKLFEDNDYDFLPRGDDISVKHHGEFR